MALLVGKYKLAKLCHLELDYAYGNDLEAGILKAMPKYAPDAKIVLTLKPKLGATDFNPFIPQVMSAGCDGVISGLWGRTSCRGSSRRRRSASSTRSSGSPAARSAATRSRAS
jgi:ABC-type branched-chain amino acid transport systems, periplasmic component